MEKVVTQRMGEGEEEEEEGDRNKRREIEASPRSTKKNVGKGLVKVLVRGQSVLVSVHGSVMRNDAK